MRSAFIQNVLDIFLKRLKYDRHLGKLHTGDKYFIKFD